VTQECDRQIDRQRDRRTDIFVANAALLFVAQLKTVSKNIIIFVMFVYILREFKSISVDVTDWLVYTYAQQLGLIITLYLI